MKWRSITAGVLAVLVAGCSSEPEMVREARKVRLIDAIRETLLESVEAEKSAVLATTDEESKSFAGQAEQSSAKINRCGAICARSLWRMDVRQRSKSSTPSMPRGRTSSRSTGVFWRWRWRIRT